MSFNASQWMAQVVRTSDYTLPLEPCAYDGLDVTVQDLARALGTIDSLPIDTQRAAALHPARCPRDVPIPVVLRTHFAEVVQELAAYGSTLHPAIRHMLLAVALSEPDPLAKDHNIDALKVLFSKNDNNKVYQPTITWLSLLRPQWFETDHQIKPVIKGGTEPNKSTQGVTTTVTVVDQGMRLNQAQLFTWAKPISFEEISVMAPPDEWAAAAHDAWSLPNPPTTSLWLMGLGSKTDFWPYISPGATLYSPFYSENEIEQVFSNNTQHTELGQYLRMGNGIADLYPLEKDSTLGSYVPVHYLLDAPHSLATWLSLHHFAKSDALPFSIPSKWVELLEIKINLAESLDMLPPYSIFHTNTTIKDFDAKQTLLDFKNTGDFQHFNALLNQAAKQQMIVSGQTKKMIGDVLDIGIPVDLYYVQAPVETPLPHNEVLDI